MPEKSAFSRLKLVRRDDMPPPPTTPSPFVELGVTSPFSFLRGASDAIELVLTALGPGYDSIGIVDRNTLAGVVRMHSACAGAGIQAADRLPARSFRTRRACSLIRSIATAMGGCRGCSASARCAAKRVSAI